MHSSILQIITRHSEKGCSEEARGERQRSLKLSSIETKIAC